MALWTVDLTTQDGAEGAAQQGGFACLLAAALGVIGLLFLWGALLGLDPRALGYVLGPALAEIAIFVIAGFRLRAGRGLVWGGVAAFVLLLELLAKIAAFNIIGLVINSVLLMGTLNGLRGAWALRRGFVDTEEAAAIFE